MIRSIFVFVILALVQAAAFAQSPFTLEQGKPKVIKPDDLAKIGHHAAAGTVNGSTITYTGKEISIVAVAGPEDDMFSYRIQGLKNPQLVVPAGAVLNVLVVNIDTDMTHDIRFGRVAGDFPAAPVLAGTAGSVKLAPRAADGSYHAQEIKLTAGETGEFRYFCSVNGHARRGMWGSIFVGTKPAAEAKPAMPAGHDHSKMGHGEMPKQASPTPTPAAGKQGHAGHMKQGEDPSADDHAQHAGGHDKMSSTINIGDPMSREGSGTSWLPDSSPMYAYMRSFDDGGMLMLHGTMFFRYTSIGSDRDVSAAGKGGRSRFDAPSMFMAMYSRPIGEKAQLGLRAMASLDPLIERGYGYPLLYQSGETYRGQPLHDRQHPHDLISELAATFSYKFDNKNSFYVYAGLPGEPAFGPPMFLHRPSGMNIPDSPIGHHWQDATHITFGVLTAGYVHDRVKFEASVFKGREPDENRWAIDAPRLDSFSGRVSLNPTKDLAFQISYGYLKDPEPSEPDIRILRKMSASAIYNRSFGDRGNWSSSFVWGQNHSDDGRSNAFLLESNYEFDKNSIFGRAEHAQKNAHELVLEDPHPAGNFWVRAYSVGYLREVVKDKGLDVGIGGMATFNFNPASIASFYGGTGHAGWQFYVRVRPSRH